MSERNEHNDGNTQTAYFAGGCFWGLERYFQNVDGVTDTTVGYAQSTVESLSVPTSRYARAARMRPKP